MNNLSTTVKMLRFVRDLEQGKETLRLDKVNQLLDFFNYEMVATSKIDNQ